MGIQQSQIEAEAERITNKLMLRIEEIEKEKAAMRLQVEAEERRLEHEKKELETKLQQSAAHLARLKHEKEALVRQKPQVEQEEEFLTNTLQHKLAKVLAEKVEIENELEQEQEYISNRLQKQVVDTLKEKQEMERRLDEEKAKVSNQWKKKRRSWLDNYNHCSTTVFAIRNVTEKYWARLNIEVEEERISNTLGKTVDQIKSEKKLEKEKAVASALSREHELQRMELKKLQGTNYVMQQRIAKESKRLTEMQREKSLIAQRLEAEWERHFNMMIRERTCYPAFNRASSLEKWNLAEMEAVDFCDNSWNSVDPDGDVLGELCLTPRNFREKRSELCTGEFSSFASDTTPLRINRKREVGVSEFALFQSEIESLPFATSHTI
eukprot:753455-Hanusia_phi.AAC.2